MDIQWYPGHMAKTRRELSENLSRIDIAAELLDARVPLSSKNPVLDELLENKPKIVVLNRKDLADPGETAKWLSFFEKIGVSAMACDAKSGSGCALFPALVKSALSGLIERRTARGLEKVSLKVMVVGIPNVGKSSFINRISGTKTAKAEDRPGVTRAQQWIRIENGLDLLDTPGMLWPKLDSKQTGECLAFTGAIKEEILDMETLAARFMETLMTSAPAVLTEKLGLSDIGGANGAELLEKFSKKRGFLFKGGVADGERAAAALLNDFRAGKLGRITLETVEEA